MSNDRDPVDDVPSHRGYQIAVADRQDAVAADADWLCEITRSVLSGEGVGSAEISVAVVDDAAIHDVNRRFLQHDDPTDVISFLLNEPDTHTPHACQSESARVPDHIDGEIVMSSETAVRCARETGAAPEEELALYLVHGLLHLCGYDDQTDADREQMRNREQSHLQKFGIHPHYRD